MSDIGSQSFKSKLKSALQALPALWRTYWRTKQELKRLAMLRYFFYDMQHTYRAMFWHSGQQTRQSLSAELLFQYHKLEKGLVMPGPRRLFGIAPAEAVMEIIARWHSAGFSKADTVYEGAIETLRAYRDRLSIEQLDPEGAILPRVKVFLDSFASASLNEGLRTPQYLPDLALDMDATGAFRRLALARRSVRNFRMEAVASHIIEEAVRIAQLSPSACNRQPCAVHLVSDEDKKKQLLALQNGNSGFGHLAPHIAIVTTDERCFFDASERHEPYVDGGLFSMSFILALRSLGVGSCCLNWCVTPRVDVAAHRLLDIHPSQRIVMLIALGYVPDECIVPRSPRRELQEVLVSH